GLIHDRGGFADVHLMIEQPERHIDQFAAAGADSITVHVETCPHLHSTLHAIADLGCRAGVTLNPATPVGALEEAARYVDVLLCLSANPGFGGQDFIPATLDRLPRMRALADARLEPVQVEVDGGVGVHTIADVHRAGANILVAGSAIFSHGTPGEAYRELCDLAGAPAHPSMVDSMSYAALGWSGYTPAATVALAQASPSLHFGRPRRQARPILRPSSTHPMESTI